MRALSSVRQLAAAKPSTDEQYSEQWMIKQAPLRSPSSFKPPSLLQPQHDTSKGREWGEAKTPALDWLENMLPAHHVSLQDLDRLYETRISGCNLAVAIPGPEWSKFKVGL